MKTIWLYYTTRENSLQIFDLFSDLHKTRMRGKDEEGEKGLGKEKGGWGGEKGLGIEKGGWGGEKDGPGPVMVSDNLCPAVYYAENVL